MAVTVLSMVMPSFSQDLPRSSWDKRGEPLFRSDDGGELKEEKEEEKEEGHISKLPAAARLACHHGDMRG